LGGKGVIWVRDNGTKGEWMVRFTQDIFGFVLQTLKYRRGKEAREVSVKETNGGGRFV
jgi:hypothetical protein